jgi:gluconokinase
MAAGIPLNDLDRKPWLNAVHERMLQYQQQGEHAIFACSALKQQYRELLGAGFANNELRFVYLHAPSALIKERMNARHHPYMNPDLFDSQLATLEAPSDAWSVSVDRSPKEAIDQILSRLREAGMLTSAAEKQ